MQVAGYNFNKFQLKLNIRINGHFFIINRKKCVCFSCMRR